MHLRRLAARLASMFLLLLLPAAAYALTVNAAVEAGFERRVRPGTATPFVVTLTADANFTGTLEVSAYGVEQRRIPVELVARKPLRIPLVITWPTDRSLRVSVLNRNDSPVRQLTEHNIVDQSLSAEMIHILEVSSSAITLPGLQRAQPPMPGANPNAKMRFVVSHCEPAALPEHTFALGSAQVIVLGDLPYDEMTPAMRTALLGWVDRGGTLIVRGGLAAAELGTSWLAPYLPLSNLSSDQRPLPAPAQPDFNVALGGSFVSNHARNRRNRDPQLRAVDPNVPVAPLPRYQPGGPGRRAVSPPPHVPAAPAPADTAAAAASVMADAVPQLSGHLAAGASVRQGGAAWSIPCGSGRIVLLAADPGLAPLRGTDEAGWLVYNCLDASVARQDAWLHNPLLLPQLTQSVSIEPPPLIIIGIFLFAYIILVGPLNFFILSRIGRRELAWVTIPAIVLVFSVLMYITGRLTMGGSTVQRELMLRFISSHAGGENFTVAAGIFSNSTDDYTLRFPPGTLDAGMLISGEPHRRSGEEPDFVIAAALPEQSEPVTINQWSWRHFSAYGSHATPVRAKYDRATRRLTITGDDDLAEACATGVMLDSGSVHPLTARGGDFLVSTSRASLAPYHANLQAFGYSPTAVGPPRLLLQREVKDNAIATRGVDDGRRTELIIIYPEVTGAAPRAGEEQ